MSLGSYRLLVDYTGRMFRGGKAAISAELTGILERLGSMPIAGGRESKRSARAACWAAPSQRAATAYAQRQTPWASIISRTWAAVLRDDAILNAHHCVQPRGLVAAARDSSSHARSG